MEVRTENGNGSLLFKWEPEEHLISVVHKKVLYSVELNHDSYLIREERSKYEVTPKQTKS